ncbi:MULTISPECIES: hypothetical protein [Asaia]|uniref:Uncharacterized protein n=1 Tax=Asaia spathodeae TaxID=657016 RepID=A0ABX2P8H8_9PROT|nr:hypothetical protein [Asaia spathodeae]GBR20349.1 hypothetical protein AA105894_2538 [Asaia spathodeae NBRC 105894]
MIRRPLGLAGATLATMMGAVAHAQTFTPEHLDRMAQERQKEIGPRNWGAPPPVTHESYVKRSLPVSVECRSPRKDFEPLFAEPEGNSERVGVAAPQIAVTSVVTHGWRQVLRVGKSFAWIPEADVVPYQPLVKGNTTRCVVAGEAANGMVLFDHPAK